MKIVVLRILELILFVSVARMALTVVVAVVGSCNYSDVTVQWSSLVKAL